MSLMITNCSRHNRKALSIKSIIWLHGGPRFIGRESELLKLNNLVERKGKYMKIDNAILVAHDVVGLNFVSLGKAKFE